MKVNGVKNLVMEERNDNIFAVTCAFLGRLIWTKSLAEKEVRENESLSL